MKPNPFLLLMVLVPSGLLGQCFSSSGNPVGGSGNMGCLDKKTLSVMAFYKHSTSDRYFEGSHQSELTMIRNANYNFTGALVAYGITNKINVEAEVGYFINKTKNYNIPAGYALRATGFTNGLISGKYQVYYNPQKKIEYSAAIGVKFPFTTESRSVDHVRLPFDLQPSTNTFGAVVQSYLIKEESFTGMRYFLYNRAEWNSTNIDGYRYGNVFINSIFISKHLIRTSNWPVSGTLILQLRNETRGRSYIHEAIEPASGSVKFFLAPQINFSFVDKWYLSLMVDIPVYQYYKYIQLADRMAFNVVLIRPVRI